MQLRWTEEAASDLERIADDLLEHMPDPATELVRIVYDAPTALLTFSNDDTISVVCILNGAQQWP